MNDHPAAHGTAVTALVPVVDGAFLPFARAAAAFAVSPDGRRVLWSTGNAQRLFADGVTTDAFAGEAAAVARQLGGSRSATLTDLSLPGIAKAVATACRVVTLADGSEALVVVPLGSLPVPEVTAPVAVAVAEAVDKPGEKKPVPPAKDDEAESDEDDDSDDTDDADDTDDDADDTDDDSDEDYDDDDSDEDDSDEDDDDDDDDADDDDVTPPGQPLKHTADAQKPPVVEAPAPVAIDQAPPVAVESPVLPAMAAVPAGIAPLTAAAFAERAAGRAVVRFLWQSDHDDRISRVSPDLSQIVGASGAGIVGGRLTEVFGRFVSGDSDRLVAILTARETVNGFRLDWPVDVAAGTVPTDLSALPIVDAARRFQGYRGFGLLRIDEFMPAPADVATPEQSVLPGIDATALALETASPPDVAGSVASAEDVGDRLADWAADAPDPITVSDVVEPATRTLAVVPPAPEKPALVSADVSQSAKESDVSAQDIAAHGDLEQAVRPHDTASIDAASDEADRDNAAMPLATAPSEPVDARAEPVDARAEPVEAGTSTGLLTATAPRAATIPFDRIRGEVAATLERRVVPLRTTGEAMPVAMPGAGETVEALPRRDGEPPPASLNPTERKAFRDIARVLGARVEGEDDTAGLTPAEAPPAVVPEPVKPSTLVPFPAEETAIGRAAGLAEEAHANAIEIIERIPVGVIVSRAERILYANRTLLDLLDYDSIAMIEAHGGLRVLFKSRSPDAAAQVSSSGPVLLAARDGESIPVDARVQSLDWGGKRATLMTIRRSLEVEQVQRLKTAEFELRHRDAELRETRSILDTATDGVALVDERGRLLSLNRAAEALFGYDQKEVAGDFFTLLMAPESHPTALDYLEGLKSGGVRSVLNDGREIVGRVRQGGRIPLFMTLGQISETPDRKFCAVLRDMTAWKKAEAELLESKRAAEKANAQKSDFLAKMSHEIRTPLNAIIGFAEVMMEQRFGAIGNERYKDYLKDIHDSGGHVISLVNDLLDLSKIEAGRMELDFVSVNVNDAVRASVTLIQPQAQRGRIVVRTSLSQKVPPVVADERSLKQIVINILSNAVKFTDPGGQVIVSTTLTDTGEVVIRVRDTGIGMTEKEIGEAFEPFRQLATTRRSGGTGLGLPLTKALVEANRGNMKITSAKREGTLVEIIFPPTRVLAE